MTEAHERNGDSLPRILGFSAVGAAAYLGLFESRVHARFFVSLVSSFDASRTYEAAAGFVGGVFGLTVAWCALRCSANARARPVRVVVAGGAAGVAWGIAQSVAWGSFNATGLVAFALLFGFVARPWSSKWRTIFGVLIAFALVLALEDVPYCLDARLVAAVIGYLITLSVLLGLRPRASRWLWSVYALGLGLVVYEARANWVHSLDVLLQWGMQGAA